MNKFQKKILPILLIIIISIGITHKSFPNDTFYIIKVGESILNNGIDMIDHFSIHHIMYPYEHWLFNIYIYSIYNTFGFIGLYIHNILLASILGFLMYFGTKKLYKNSVMSLIITIISLFLLRNFIVTRAQLVSYIIFILEIFCLESLFYFKKKIYILFLFILSILLVNVHAAVWPMFFILYIPYIVEFLYSIYKKKIIRTKTIYLKLKKILIQQDCKNIKYVLISLIICVMGGFINPNHNQCFTYFIKVKMGNSMNIISEHQPTELYTRPLFFTYLLCILIYLVFLKKKHKLKNICFILGLFILSLSSYRHIALFITIGSFIIVESFSDIIITGIVKKKIIIFITSFSIITSLIIFYSDINNKYISNNYPINAVNYINHNIDKKKMRLFNGYNYGSFLLFNDIPVFIDSRANLYTKEFNNLDSDIFNDYHKIIFTGKYKKYFKQYNINYILIEQNTILDYALKCDYNYKVIYSDEKYILYKKI